VYIDEEMKQLLAQYNIRLVTFPSHTSHLLQPFDLITFAAFTFEKGEIYVDQSARSQIEQITKPMKTS
jgi:hypothetical protein